MGAVILGHSQPSMPPAIGRFIPAATGEVGVQIFFVLSGYLITRLLMEEYAATGAIDFRGFYRRRVLRIFPAFYTYVLLITALMLIGLLRISWRQIIVAGTFLWNYAHLLRLDAGFQAHQQGNWYLGHSWSLALEEQFYWVWPITFLLICRKHLRYLLPGAILAVPILKMLSYVFFPHDRVQLVLMFHTGSDVILTGCFLAMEQPALERRLLRYLTRPSYLTASLVIVLVVFNLAESHLGGYYRLTYGLTVNAIIIAFMMLAILHQPRHWFSRLLGTPVFMFGGTISFSLYLWQQLFDNRAMPIHLSFPLSAAAAVATATLSYYFVERPFLQLKNKGPIKPSVVLAAPPASEAAPTARP